jgi:hypothetical protein
MPQQAQLSASEIASWAPHDGEILEPTNSVDVFFQEPSQNNETATEVIIEESSSRSISK